MPINVLLLWEATKFAMIGNYSGDHGKLETESLYVMHNILFENGNHSRIGLRQSLEVQIPIMPSLPCPERNCD